MCSWREKGEKKCKQETIYYLLATSLFYIFVYHNYIKSFHSDCQIKGLHMATRCCQMQFQRYLASYMSTSHPKLGQKIEKNGMGAFGQSSNHPEVVKNQQFIWIYSQGSTYIYYQISTHCSPNHFPLYFHAVCHWIPIWPRDSTQNAPIHLTLAKRTQGIDPQPLIHTIFVEKMGT